MFQRMQTSDPCIVSACLVALCMGGCAGELEPTAEGVSVASSSAALINAGTVLHLKVFEVDSGFDETAFINTGLPAVNRLFANTNFQIVYDGKEKATSTVCTDADLSQVAAEGNKHRDVIPVFYCKNPDFTAGQGAFVDNFVAWNEGTGLDHEIGHYLSLPHTFSDCWTASVDEANRLNAEGSCGGKWQSAEGAILQEIALAASSCERPSSEDHVASCPALDAAIAGAAGRRDAFLDGDRIDDTPLALHVYPATVDACAPGYRVPLIVNVETLFLVTSLDLSFEPGFNNRMDYKDCPATTAEGPDAYSPQQIAAMHHALDTNRNGLLRPQDPGPSPQELCQISCPWYCTAGAVCMAPQ